MKGVLAAIGLGAVKNVPGCNDEIKSKPEEKRETTFEKIVKILKKNFKINILRSGRARTIIIVEDQHMGDDPVQGWEADYNKVNTIRQTTGINTIGLEGWAGHAADQMRGYVLLNGERQFVAKVLSDNNFIPIPLEEMTLQEETLKNIIIWTFLSYFKYRHIVMHNNGNDRDRKFARTYLNACTGLCERFRITLTTHVPEKILRMPAFREILTSVCRRANVNLTNLTNFVNDPLPNEEVLIKIRRVRDDYEVDRRSKVFAQRIKSDLKKGDGIMVVGKEHTTIVAAHLKSMTDWNIIVIPTR